MPTQRRMLHPEIGRHCTERLRVSALHELHWEECGNPQGNPVVSLHGGPGPGTSPMQRRIFALSLIAAA